VLLLRRGSSVASAAQLERLIESGLYSDDPAASKSHPGKSSPAASTFAGKHVSVIALLEDARTRVAGAFAQTDPAIFPALVLELARQVRAASLLDPDAAIGDTVASRGGFYPARHAVNCAALGTLLLERLEATDEQIEACLCALLTMNLAMVDLQATMYGQAEPLTDAQRQVTSAHPLRGAGMLRERGVRSDAWLEAVTAHHELQDGSGYPAGLKGEAIGRDARLITIVDQYCALVSERAFRQGVNPSAAIRHLLVNQGQGLDPALAALLVRELTPYPPGAAVRLANQELAIVCRRTRHPEQPIARAVVSSEGRPYPEPRKRVTSQSAYRIDKPVAQAEIRNFPPARLLWDDSFTAA
jgi:HD-GYP domain-containing protein (c-di-GMP phosphodiesterase class II)